MPPHINPTHRPYGAVQYAIALFTCGAWGFLGASVSSFLQENVQVSVLALGCAVVLGIIAGSLWIAVAPLNIGYFMGSTVRTVTALALGTISIFGPRAVLLDGLDPAEAVIICAISLAIGGVGALLVARTIRAQMRPEDPRE